MPLFSRKVLVRIENEDTGDVFEFEDLHVEFEIERTLEKEPSQLFLSVFNLSDDTRKGIGESGRRIITFDAGYGDALYTLFKGDIRTLQHRREGPNLITTIEAGDGERGTRNWAKKTWSKGASLSTVVKYLIQKAGFTAPKTLNQTLNTYEQNGIPTSFKSGFAVHGYAVDELHEVLNGRGIEFSIQGNQVLLLPLGEAISGTDAVLLSEDTGMKGTPTLRTEQIGDTVKTKEVLEVECILVPNIYPGTIVEVQSEFVRGRFRVNKATYAGSVFGQDFGISIEGQPV